MSRIGRHPIAIPAGVTVTVSDDNHVVVKGPKGQLEQTVNKNITVKVEGNEVHVTRPNDEKTCAQICARTPRKTAEDSLFHTQITHTAKTKVPAGRNDGRQGLFLLHFAAKTGAQTLAIRGLIC